jgi:hypothetical protein
MPPYPLIGIMSAAETRNSEQIKSIRRGECKIEKIEAYFSRKESYLDALYKSGSLR